MDSSTNGWDENKELGISFKDVFINLISSMTNDEAYTQAMTYVMSKYNTGLILYRQKNMK